MVYIKSWAQFQSQCMELYQSNPTKVSRIPKLTYAGLLKDSKLIENGRMSGLAFGQARYLIKAHPASQWLILKVTDDVRTIKYKSRSAAILNRFESLNKDLAAAMVGLPLPSRLQAEAEAKAVAEAASAAAASRASAADSNQMDVDAPADGNKGAAAAGGSGAGKSGTGAGGSGGGGGGKKKKKKGKK
ncbi:hypothetical protein OC861_004302 [Tilletia horrida]|nr:hypothetical protein OC861_004302 [Tilletia horrida]